MSIDAKGLAVGLAKTAGVWCEEPAAINPELQSLVGDPDDTAVGIFSQKRTNPGSLQLPNPLSPIQGDEVFFTYLWPGAVFQSHDGQQWVIEAYDFYGQIEITNRWYPRQRAQVSLMDIRHSIDQWVEPIQQVVPPAPPGVNYDAQNVRIVE